MRGRGTQPLDGDEVLDEVLDEFLARFMPPV